jgi:hypothetical protein
MILKSAPMLSLPNSPLPLSAPAPNWMETVAQDGTATVKAHDMERIIPTQINKIERTPPMHGQ